MTDNQINSLNMANTVTAFLDKNNGIFNTNTKVNTLLTAIKATVLSLNQTAAAQGINTTGATAAKHQLKQVATDKALHVSGGLQAYYEDINDLTLAAEYHFTDSDFTHGAIAENIVKMQFVHDKAASITTATSTPLLPFLVTAADISDLQIAITNLINSVPVKKVMQAGTTAATALLPVQFTTMRGQLEKMDTLIGNYKMSQSSFVEGYSNARKINNLGKTLQAKELHLEPHHFEAIFAKKFKKGDTFTVRNHSEDAVSIFLTDTPKILPTSNGIIIQPQAEVKVSVPSDFADQFGHWLTVFNPSDIDDAHVTVILAHGKSKSQAAEIGNVAP